MLPKHLQEAETIQEQQLIMEHHQLVEHQIRNQLLILQIFKLIQIHHKDKFQKLIF